MSPVTGGFSYVCRRYLVPGVACATSRDCVAGEGCLLEPGASKGRCVPDECAQGCTEGERCALQFTRLVRVDSSVPRGDQAHPDAPSPDTFRGLGCFPEQKTTRERPYSMRSPCDRQGVDLCQLEEERWVCSVMVSMHPCGRPLLIEARARLAALAQGGGWG